jgi:hypothetical protein
MGNKLVCYNAAIFMRISLMSIAYQGNVIKVARNKKALWEKNVIKEFCFLRKEWRDVHMLYCECCKRQQDPLYLALRQEVQL